MPMTRAAESKPKIEWQVLVKLIFPSLPWTMGDGAVGSSVANVIRTELARPSMAAMDSLSLPRCSTGLFSMYCVLPNLTPFMASTACSWNAAGIRSLEQSSHLRYCRCSLIDFLPNSMMTTFVV